jgi:hypothetical protein
LGYGFQIRSGCYLNGDGNGDDNPLNWNNKVNVKNAK